MLCAPSCAFPLNGRYTSGLGSGGLGGGLDGNGLGGGGGGGGLGGGDDGGAGGHDGKAPSTGLMPLGIVPHRPLLSRYEELNAVRPEGMVPLNLLNWSPLGRAFRRQFTRNGDAAA